ncbi:MAG: hypothetical protein IPP83_14250 [Flavobacteriales bacterium]|nr:hypothetical protein [Flavobacteriales bacterium]
MDRSLPSVLAALLMSGVSAQGPPAFHWPLDESSGVIAQAWGGTNGTLAGGTTWDPTGGHHQGAARFDGVNDRIILGSCDLTSGTGFSISFWTKADFVTGMERTLIAKTTGPQLTDHIWSVAFVNGTSLRFRLQTGGTTSELSTGPSSLFGSVWYHIVATYDGAIMRVVLNGALMASAPKSGSIGLHPQSPASIGALSTGTQPYSGWIDDVRIYDRALTDNEILELLFGSMTTSINEAQGPITLSDLLRNPAPTDRIVVRDMLGRMELSGNTGASAPIDLSSLSAGIHMVCLEGRDGCRSVRVFVP